MERGLVDANAGRLRDAPIAITHTPLRTNLERGPHTFYLDRMARIRQAILVEDFSSYLQVNRQTLQDAPADTEV